MYSWQGDTYVYIHTHTHTTYVYVTRLIGACLSVGDVALQQPNAILDERPCIAMFNRVTIAMFNSNPTPSNCKRRR